MRQRVSMLPKALIENRQDKSGRLESWDTKLAHEVLSDLDRRKAYDRYGEDYVDSPIPFPSELPLKTSASETTFQTYFQQMSNNK